jgi:hypothetical protein
MIVTSELDIIVISLIYIACEHCCTLNNSPVVAYWDQEFRSASSYIAINKIVWPGKVSNTDP